MKGKKLVYGVGINDADYVVQVKESVFHMDGGRRQKYVWTCPFYRIWKEMLRRCYSLEYKERRPTYGEASTHSEWFLFSNFKVWMEKQNWKGKQLDKDLLVPGNKVYGPETCIFVSQKVNTFLIECDASRGDNPIGVSWHKSSGKYQARCRGALGKTVHLGLFGTPEEAHQAWLAYKLKLAYALAEEQTDPRVAKALIDRYENYEEKQMNYENLSNSGLVAQYVKEMDNMSFYQHAEGESYYKERTMREACSVRRKEIIAECKARGLELPVHNWMC